MKTIPQVSQETLILQNYLVEKCKEGEEISFARIQNDTKVKMDSKGKQYLRTAFKRAKLIYLSIRGYGIKIAESSDTMPILVNKLGRIDKAVKRADKTQKTLQSKFFDSLEPHEQKEILYIGAVFGAIRVAADNGKLIYQKTKNKMSESTMNIPIPQL